MEKEKIIEEMARDICECYWNDGTCFQDDMPCDLKCEHMTEAQFLYEKGYRKERQGEWIYHESVVTDDGLISGYSCSLCDAFVYEDEFNTDEFHKKYCGNCGAKMKGE